MLRKRYERSVLLAALLLATVLFGATAWATGNTDTASHGAQIKRGHYVVDIGGCNDCHTPGFALHGGHAPEDQLLTGSGQVFVGPWGTSFPTNLRLYMQQLTLKQWLQEARTLKTLPPMPWYAVRAMSRDDLVAVYYYVRSLGPAGKPAHKALPPGKLPPPPYNQVVLPPRPSK